ncbi:MAG: GLPGLI family protein [Muribaculaceae bacterium]|nr:GLPGLI family protein [Muribaculaceae bacterium]
MKKILLLLLLCLGAMCAKAEKSDLVVSYDYVLPNFVGKLRHFPMVLLSNQQMSKFYSPPTEYVDSITSTPQGVADYQQMQQTVLAGGNWNSLPVRKETSYIFRSKKDDRIKVYDSIAADVWVYEEEFEPQNWTIIPDSTKTILGYECLKAECTYRGREWTAWFAPEIPVADGPWLLCGLPGLILEAKESTGNYSFVADGIRQEAREIRPVYGKDKYQSTERKKFLQLKKLYSQNPNAYLGNDTSGAPSPKYDKNYDLLERDYKN